MEGTRPGLEGTWRLAGEKRGGEAGGDTGRRWRGTLCQCEASSLGEMLEVVEAGARMERREMEVEDSLVSHDLQAARSSGFRGPKLFLFSSISLFGFGTRPGADIYHYTENTKYTIYQYVFLSEEQ